MAYTYRGMVDSGYASAPEYIDDQTGESYLDVQGLLGPPPSTDTGFDTMRGALASNAPTNWAQMGGGVNMAPSPEPPPRMGAPLPPEPIMGLDIDPPPKPMTIRTQPTVQQAPETNPYIDALQRVKDQSGRGTYVAPRTEGWSPRAMTTGMDPRDIQAMSGSIDEVAGLRREAAVAEALNRAEYAKQDALIRRAQNDDREEQIRHNQNELATKAQRLKAFNEKTMSRVEAVRAKRVDPNKIYRDRGVVGNILAAVVAGAGQYAASMNGGPNMAAQIIENQTERDIKAQEDDIAAGRDDADSMLAELRREYGTMDEAKQVLGAMMREHKMATLQELAQGREESAIGTQLMSVYADIAEKQAQAKVELQSKAQTKVESEWQAGRRGGYVAPDPLTELERIDRAGKTLVSIRGNTDKLTGEADLGENAEERFEKFGAAMKDSDEVGAALREANDVIRRNADSDGDIPGVGLTGILPNIATSAKGTDVRAALGMAGALVRHRLTGAASSDTEKAEIDDLVGGLNSPTTTDDQRRANLARLERIYLAQRRRAVAAYGGKHPERFQAEWQRRLGQAQHQPGFDAQPMQGREYTGKSRLDRLVGD